MKPRSTLQSQQRFQRKRGHGRLAGLPSVAHLDHSQGAKHANCMIDAVVGEAIEVDEIGSDSLYVELQFG